jgi:hypothetical protein
LKFGESVVNVNILNFPNLRMGRDKWKTVSLFFSLSWMWSSKSQYCSVTFCSCDASGLYFVDTGESVAKMSQVCLLIMIGVIDSATFE